MEYKNSNSAKHRSREKNQQFPNKRNQTKNEK